MAALTADRNTTFREGGEIEIPMAASTTIYAGSLVMWNAAGYAVPGADTASCTFIGVSIEKAVNGVTAGATKVRVKRRGVFQFDASGLTQAKVGVAMCIVDDHTIADAGVTTNDVPCGRLTEYISATLGWVDIGVNWVS
jgi:hypothetical protein